MKNYKKEFKETSIAVTEDEVTITMANKSAKIIFTNESADYWGIVNLIHGIEQEKKKDYKPLENLIFMFFVHFLLALNNDYIPLYSDLIAQFMDEKLNPKLIIKDNKDGEEYLQYSKLINDSFKGNNKKIKK